MSVNNVDDRRARERRGASNLLTLFKRAPIPHPEHWAQATESVEAWRGYRQCLVVCMRLAGDSIMWFQLGAPGGLSEHIWPCNSSSALQYVG
jgi:hypothetical protein